MDLFHEAYELLFNIINVKEFYKICVGSGIDNKFLQLLIQFLEQPEAESIFGDQLKDKKLALKEVARTYGSNKGWNINGKIDKLNKILDLKIFFL